MAYILRHIEIIHRAIDTEETRICQLDTDSVLVDSQPRAPYPFYVV